MGLAKIFVGVGYLVVVFFTGFSFTVKLFLFPPVLFFLFQATWKKTDKMSIYFGVPGSGKTTFAAWYARQAQKQGIKVLSNVPIKGTYKFERSDIGKFDISNCLMLLDEGSLEYNNRDFKRFGAEENQFWSLHRHAHVEPIIFSQGASDVDKRLRTLCQRMYYVQRSLIPYCIVRRQIIKVVCIDCMSHDICDGYEFAKFSRRYILSPLLWRMFDSFDMPVLPKKDFIPWFNNDLVSSDFAFVCNSDDEVLSFEYDECEGVVLS